MREKQGFLRKPFNSRPHKEVDERNARLRGRCYPFNSRPHKEVDDNTESETTTKALSIHDLTRRSTVFLIFYIHIRIPFNSRPHKEVDNDAPISSGSYFSFNSRPHKEVDPMIIGDLKEGILSIHDLTRRSTSTGMSPCRYILTFQFTTSQGGRPCKIRHDHDV